VKLNVYDIEGKL